MSSYASQRQLRLTPAVARRAQATAGPLAPGTGNGDHHLHDHRSRLARVRSQRCPGHQQQRPDDRVLLHRSDGTDRWLLRNCYAGKRKPCVAHIYHAFVYSNGTMTDLGTLGGNYSQANVINLSGEVVGSASTSTGGSSFLWDGKKMTALSGLGAYGINDSGQIAGVCGPNPGSHACLDSNGKVTQLPNPSTFTPYDCSASAINNNGQILGGCDDTSSYEHAVLWQNGTPTDLGTFGGPQAKAAGINNLGQVVGFAQTSTDADHGFLWSNGQMTDLGLNFFPAAINDNGQIVANAYDTNTCQGHALLLTPD